MTVFDDVFPSLFSPFGFDSVSVGAGDTMEVAPLDLDTPSAAWSGAGIRGATASAATHNSYPFQQVEGVLVKWRAIQPTRYDQFTIPAGLDACFDDAKADTLAGSPYKLILRISCGTDAPVGPSGASWMVGGPSAANNSKPVEVVNAVSTDVNSGSPSSENIPVPWSANHRYHYARLIDWLDAVYLHPTDPSGLTAGGTRRSDYVFFVPVAFATESGTEMPLGYGPHAQFPSSGSVTVDGHTYTSTSKGYIDVVNRASWAKHVPSTVRSAGQAAINTWLRARYKDGWDWSIQYHMDNLSAESCVAWGGIFADNYTAARALIDKFIPLYGRSKLWSMQTNLRINPPKKLDGSPDWNAPKFEWSYMLWSLLAAGLMSHIQSLAPAGTRAKLGFQTAGATNSSGGYGMPPGDYPWATQDALDYGAMFIETYSGVFSNATYGPSNRTYTRDELQPALADNAALVTAAAPSGFDNALHIVVPTAPTAGSYGSIGFSDAPDFWYLVDLASVYTPGGQRLLQSLTSSSDGVLEVTINPDSTLTVEWDGVEVHTSIDVVTDFDTLEVHHICNGAGGSGFEIRLNGVQIVIIDNLDSTGSVNSARLGAPDAQPAELQITRFAGDDSFWVGDLAQPNATPPVVTIAALPTQVNNLTLVVTATVTEPVDGIADVEVSVNDGPTTQMLFTGVPDQYAATIQLQGTAGALVTNVISVIATDSNPLPATTEATASLVVALSSTSGIGGTVAFTRTLLLGTGQFAAMHDRWIAMGHFLEGVAPPEAAGENTGDVTAALVVTPDLGAMTATVSAGWAFIEGDNNQNQGMYADYNDGDVVVTQTDGAPAAGTQRVDVLVAFLNDSEHTIETVGGVDAVAFGYATGQAGAGSSLEDKDTWPDLPPTALPLCVLLADDSGFIDSIDCRKAYGPALWGEDGNRYRVGIRPDGLLGTEQVKVWPDWVTS